MKGSELSEKEKKFDSDLLSKQFSSIEDQDERLAYRSRLAEVDTGLAYDLIEKQSIESLKSLASHYKEYPTGHRFEKTVSEMVRTKLEDLVLKKLIPDDLNRLCNIHPSKEGENHITLEIPSSWKAILEKEIFAKYMAKPSDTKEQVTNSSHIYLDKSKIIGHESEIAAALKIRIEHLKSDYLRDLRTFITECKRYMINSDSVECKQNIQTQLLSLELYASQFRDPGKAFIDKIDEHINKAKAVIMEDKQMWQDVEVRPRR